MSYDVSLHAPVRHSVTYTEWDRNITYNLAPMMREGGVNLRDLDGQTADRCWVQLTELHRQMVSEPARFEAHNPPNKWGDYPGCLDFVRDFIRACESRPDGIVLVD
jgi:hypothetical protein